MNTPTSSNEIHVIFGAGPLGQAVMRELVKRGQRVRMVNRGGTRPAGTPDSVAVVAGDAYNLDSARQACRDAAVVYQCANAPYDQWPEKFPPLQTNIVEAAASAGAKLVVADNLYMYGKVNGPFHEALPNRAHTVKGQTRAKMAEAVMAAHQSGKVRAAIGRASNFFGPGVLASTAGQRMFGPAVQGQAAEGIGNIDLPHTHTFIDDFGKALVVLGERPEALGQIWHVPSAETLTTRQFIRLIFEELGLPPKISVIGSGKMWLGSLFMPAARGMLEMMYEFETPFVVDHSKFTRAFGDHATPHRAAIKQTVAWYRAHVGGGQ